MQLSRESGAPAISNAQHGIPALLTLFCALPRQERGYRPAAAPVRSCRVPGALWELACYGAGWQPGSLKLPIRVCHPASALAWPAAV